MSGKGALEAAVAINAKSEKNKNFILTVMAR